MKELMELKRKVCKIGLIFLALMLLLTMLSKTIYTLLLPHVMAEKVAGGAIVTEIYSNGKIGFDELMIDKMQVVIKTTKEGQATKCYVKENDRVKKGDALIEIEGQADEEKQMEEGQTRNEIEINMGAYEREKESIMSQYQNKEEELTQKQELLQDFTDDYQIIELEQQILEKQKEVVVNEALYEAGGIAQSELDKGRDSLKLMQEKCMLLKQDHDTKLNEEIKEIQEKLEELQNSLLQQDEKLAIEKNKLVMLETRQGKKTLYSPINGIVYELKIGVGATAAMGDELMIIIPDEIPITLAFRGDQDLADKLEIAGKVLWAQGQNERSAEVIKKTYDKEKEETIITCQLKQSEVSDWITDYKTYKQVNINITHKSERYEYIVPTSAISYEGDRAYVYSIEEKDTVFEKQYIAHKEAVTVLEEGDEKSAVEGIVTEKPIVVMSTKVLKDNTEVKLK